MAKAELERTVQQSVLDRLVDDDPTNQAESPMSRAESVRALKESLRRDLEALLNTRRTAETAPEELPQGRRATRAPTAEELEQTYAALEQGLGAIEFFKARKPAAVMRTLRTLIARAEPDLREARLLAAVGYEIGHYIQRLRDASDDA